MQDELNTFEYFVDDFLESDFYLLKGEIDFLLMQHIFQSIDLKSLDSNYKINDNFLAA